MKIKTVDSNCQMENVDMLVKRLVGFSVLCLWVSGAASAMPASPSFDTERTAQMTVPCSEYKNLTGLDLCHVQPVLLLAEARYEELVQTHQTGSCLDTVKQTYGTLQCHTLGDAFQAWQGRDVSSCEREVFQCSLSQSDASQTRLKTERSEIPTVEARFMRLGLANSPTP